MNGIECLGERVADKKFLVVQDARPRCRTCRDRLVHNEPRVWRFRNSYSNSNGAGGCGGSGSAMRIVMPSLTAIATWRCSYLLFAAFWTVIFVTVIVASLCAELPPKDQSEERGALHGRRSVTRGTVHIAASSRGVLATRRLAFGRRSARARCVAQTTRVGRWHSGTSR